MLDSAHYRKLRSSKMYITRIERKMSENGSIEKNVTGNSSENVDGEIPNMHTLTQEAANDRIKGFIALLTRQLDALIRLVQGMVTTPHPSHYPRTDFGTTSCAAAHQSGSCDLTFFPQVISIKLLVSLLLSISSVSLPMVFFMDTKTG